MDKEDNNIDEALSSLERRKVLKGTARIMYTTPILTMLNTSLKANTYTDDSSPWTAQDPPPDPPPS